jgi:ATP-dependent Clp protease ATP-binding subunit ClpC
MSIILDIDDELVDFIADTGFDEKFGARPLRRAIQNLVEDKLAEEVLDGNIHSGDTAIVQLIDKAIKISRK